MPNRLFIHATNVHQGGGRELLHALLVAAKDLSHVIALLDSRMPVHDDVYVKEGISIKRITPSVIERFKAERWLADNVLAGDIVLCFGNLPPIFKLKGRAIVFLQNRYLIDSVSISNFPIKTRARIIMERLWLRLRMSNVNEFIVQTPTMKNLLDIKTQGKIPVHVSSVVKSDDYKRSVSGVRIKKGEVCNFLYVASGEPHKNHLRLIKAWCFLAKEGLFPSLTLTLDRINFRTLCCEIEERRQQYKLKVTNIGILPHDEIIALYDTVDALIYPSTFESFGLPLIEARQANLPVLAPELDYVRDLVDPEQTFDPKSSTSIARAVKRFLGLYESSLPLVDAEHFMKNILENVK